MKEFPTAEEASPEDAPVPDALASEPVSVPVEASVVEVPSAEVVPSDAVPSVVVPSAVLCLQAAPSGRSGRGYGRGRCSCRSRCGCRSRCSGDSASGVMVTAWLSAGSSAEKPQPAIVIDAAAIAEKSKMFLFFIR